MSIAADRWKVVRPSARKRSVVGFVVALVGAALAFGPGTACAEGAADLVAENRGAVKVAPDTVPKSGFGASMDDVPGVVIQVHKTPMSPASVLNQPEANAPDTASSPAKTNVPAVPTMADVRRASPIATYRLERALYDHSLTVARGLAAQSSPGTPVLGVADLAPPARPQIEFDATDEPHSGPATDAVHVVVIENLSQIYSQRLDARIAALQRKFPDRIRVSSVTVGARTHRNSFLAAAAADCVRDEEKFWAYRAVLLANLRAQTQSDLEGYAEALGVEPEQFRVCLGGDKTRRRVEHRTARAARAGLTPTPVILVDGVYVGGAENDDELEALVAAAVAQISSTDGLAATEQAFAWKLTGVMMVPGRSQAVFSHPIRGATRVVIVGDRLDPEARVDEIHADHVLVNHKGEIVRIDLTRAEVVAPPVKSSGPATSETLKSDRAMVVENVARLPIDAATRAKIWRERAGMESQFEAGGHDVDGERFLKLTGTDHAGLFSLLGLQHRDVLVRVNDDWVFAGQNRLFDAILDPTKEGTAVIVRRGIPRLLVFDPTP